MSLGGALIIFLGTQWVQARNALFYDLRTKLEDYYCSLSEIEKNMGSTSEMERQAGTVEGFRLGRDRAHELLRCLSRPQMHAGMYFRETLEKFNELGAAVDEFHIWIIAFSGKSLQEGTPAKGEQIHNRVYDLLLELRRVLIRDQAKLTRRPCWKR